MTHGLDLSHHDNRKKSRKGSIPKNVSTLLKKASMDAFMQEIEKLSEDDADGGTEKAMVSDATATLKKKPSNMKSTLQMAGVGAVAAPIIEAVGRFAQGALDHSGGGGKSRTAHGIAEVMKMTKGDVAKRAIVAGLAGGAIGLGKVKLDTGRARKVLEKHYDKLRGERSKEAAAPAVPGIPGVPKIAPSLGSVAPRLPTNLPLRNNTTTPAKPASQSHTLPQTARQNTVATPTPNTDVGGTPAPSTAGAAQSAVASMNTGTTANRASPGTGLPKPPT